MTLERGTRVVVAGDPGDNGSGGKGEGSALERIQPGYLGTVDFTDSLGTVHVQWAAGFRRGVEAKTAAWLLRRVVAVFGTGEIVYLTAHLGGLNVVCAGMDDDRPHLAPGPGHRVPAGQYFRHWDDLTRQPVWTDSPGRAYVARTTGEAAMTVQPWATPMNAYLLAITHKEP